MGPGYNCRNGSLLEGCQDESMEQNKVKGGKTQEVHTRLPFLYLIQGTNDLAPTLPGSPWTSGTNDLAPTLPGSPWTSGK
ncbi:hypothetical protein AOLI_G00016170 [Acnodon oligacanthus]